MTGHAAHEPSIKLEPMWLSVPRRAVLVLAGTAVLGLAVAGSALPLYADGWRRFQLGYLTAFAFVASLSLGALFFVLLQHLTRAGWSVLVRRPAEIFALNIVTVALMSLPIVWWVYRGELYPWAGGADAEAASAKVATHLDDQTSPTKRAVHSAVEASGGHDVRQTLYGHQQLDELTRSKVGWLNRPGFIARTVVYFAIWTAIAGFYFVRSRRQDLGEGAQQTRVLEWSAGLAAIGFALSLTFASFDWLMSLDPHWYSTMFGVYFFAGSAVGAMALMLLTLLWVSHRQLFPDVLSAEHRRDLGRFLFAFVFFWGYIAFSQYMLLWYANVPETTRWYVVRGASQATGYGNSWGWLLLVLLLGHFLIPFLGTMSRHVKSNQRAMIFWSSWLLVMHYLDLYWLVMPELGPHLTIGPMEIGLLLTVGGVWLLGASLIATRTRLIPVGDPRLGESLRVTEAY